LPPKKKGVKVNNPTYIVSVAARELFNKLGLQDETKRKTLQNTDILRDLLEMAIIAGMQIQAKEVIKRLEEIQSSIR